MREKYGEGGCVKEMEKTMEAEKKKVRKSSRKKKKQMMNLV